MAAIDKIYGNHKQYDEFYKWCEKNKPEALKHFNRRCNIEGCDENHAITNFPEDIDEWMIENCEIDWVINYIKDQYNIENGS